MELCEESSLGNIYENEETFEKPIDGIEIRLPRIRTSKEVIRLEKLSQKAVYLDDLISEKLKKLEKLLPDNNFQGQIIENKIRRQLEGLALSLTAYKLKTLQGKLYLDSNKFSDNFIEVMYLSNILKGINTSLLNMKKKPHEIRDLLYSVFLGLLKQEGVLEKKERLKLNNRKRMYHVLTSRFSEYNREKVLEDLEGIGRDFESIKNNNIRKKIEEQLAYYKKLPYESLKKIETMEVAKALICEEENIRYALSKNTNR
ncbi:MAG: hypothetical protein QW404_03565 [Candidatus Nanoarchaeia archaeon]